MTARLSRDHNDYLLISAAVTAEAKLEAWKQSDDYDKNDSTQKTDIIRSVVVNALDAASETMRWSRSDDDMFFSRVRLAIHMITTLRRMEPGQLAMEAFGPESVRSRAATLLLARNRETS